MHCPRQLSAPARCAKAMENAGDSLLHRLRLQSLTRSSLRGQSLERSLQRLQTPVQLQQPQPQLQQQLRQPQPQSQQLPQHLLQARQDWRMR